MRILGLDPGVATTGFGLLDADPPGRFKAVSFGTIRTPPDLALPERLKAIRADLCSLLARYRPDRAAVETLFFNRNTRSWLAVGQVRGVLLVTLAEEGIPLTEYGPSVVKRAVAGSGRGSKAAVGAMVARLLDLANVPRPDDVADALAIALCLGMERPFHQAIETQTEKKTAIDGNRSFDKEGGV